MFSGCSLYEDRVEEEKKKKEEKRKKKKREDELKQKRKDEWEKLREEKVNNGEEFPSFEEWDKERRKAEEDEKNMKRKEADEKRRKLSQEKQKAKKDGKKHDSSSSDEETLTEKELAMFRGYKKTTDGRTTSYFNRELSNAEKSLIGNTTPQLLTTSSNTTPSTSLLSNTSSPRSSSLTSSSAWNTAQTWEERNTTDWCSSCLKRKLQDTVATTVMLKAHFYDVEVKGDSCFATSSGRKRYIFDFHATVKFKVFIPVTADVESEGPPSEDDDVLAKGTLVLPDVSSTVDDGQYEINLTWKKRTKEPWGEKVMDFGKAELAGGVRGSVKAFVDEFNTQY